LKFFKKRPNMQDVIDRAFCTAAVMIYGTAQNEFAAGEFDQDKPEMLIDLRAWVARERIHKSFSAKERRLFDAPVGGWSERELIDISWTIECLGVFLWALNLVEELPAYDVPFDFRLSEIIAIDSEKKNFAKSMRPKEVVDHQRDVSELWHWRSVNARFSAGEIVDPSTPIEERMRYALSAAATAHDRGDIPSLIDGDFPAFGKAYKDLDPSERSEMASIARERERAFNWLVGYEWNWDDVPTDT
jgi:hypothetical protein